MEKVEFDVVLKERSQVIRKLLASVDCLKFMSLTLHIRNWLPLTWI